MQISDTPNKFIFFRFHLTWNEDLFTYFSKHLSSVNWQISIRIFGYCWNNSVAENLYFSNRREHICILQFVHQTSVSYFERNCSVCLLLQTPRCLAQIFTNRRVSCENYFSICSYFQQTPFSKVLYETLNLLDAVPYVTGISVTIFAAGFH